MVALRVASVGIALALWLGACSSSTTTPDAPGDAGSQRPRAGASTNVAELDLRGMLPPVPEYEGQGRNLFAYGAARQPPRPLARATTTIPSTASATTSIMRAPVTRPSVRVDVKYAGFVEKTEVSGAKAKYAIFLDGNEILAGAEGETIANRFTVVEIGLESVTVSAEGSTATQRIPLQAN